MIKSDKILFLLALLFSLYPITSFGQDLIPYDTVYYRLGEESIRFIRDIEVKDVLERKSKDTLIIYMKKGDQFLLQGESNRSLSVSFTDPNDNVLFASSFSGVLNSQEVFAMQEGAYQLVYTNAGLILNRKFNFSIQHIQEHKLCSDSCVEFSEQRRERPLPKKILTTVSSKSPQKFSARYNVYDTLTLYVPETSKLPHIEVLSSKDETLFQLGSQKGPINLKVPILDTGIVKVHLSKDGLLGRFPTDHELFLGRITPALNSDSCCVYTQLYPKEKIHVVQDTIAITRLDTLVQLAATRNIRSKSSLEFDIEVDTSTMTKNLFRLAFFVSASKKKELDQVVEHTLRIKDKKQLISYLENYGSQRIDTKLKNNIYLVYSGIEYLLDTDFNWFIWDESNSNSLVIKQENKIMASEIYGLLLDFQLKFEEVYQE